MQSPATPFPSVVFNQDKTDLPIIVFIAGFPDNQTSGWGTIIPEYFKKTHRLIFLCLPGYDDSKKLKKWGYDHDELLLLLHQTLTMLIPKGEKFHFVIHDWGSHIGTRYQNTHPDVVKSLTMVDVGICSMTSLPIFHCLLIVGYQVWFAMSYFLSQIIGLTLATLFFKIYFWLPVPADYKPNPKKVHVPVSSITPLMCYPYYHLLRELLTTGNMKLPQFPSCPTLYVVSYCYINHFAWIHSYFSHSMDQVRKLIIMIKIFSTNLPRGRIVVVRASPQVYSHLVQ